MKTSSPAHRIKDSIRNGLIGSLEMVLLMPNPGRWFADDRRSACTSFIIPVLLIFYVTWGTYTNILSDMGAYFWLIGYGLVISRFKLAVFLWMVRLIAKGAGQLERFWHFVHANNWMIFISCILLTPSICVLQQTGSAEASFPYLICGMFYSFLALSVCSVRVLHLSWEQSMLLTVAGIIANGAIFIAFGRVGGLIIL